MGDVVSADVVMVVFFVDGRGGGGAVVVVAAAAGAAAVDIVVVPGGGGGTDSVSFVAVFFHENREDAEDIFPASPLPGLVGCGCCSRPAAAADASAAAKPIPIQPRDPVMN